MKILFFGTSEFSDIILQKLIKSRKYSPSLIVTAPDKPQGRNQESIPPPVKKTAEDSDIEVLQPEKLDDEFIATIKDKADWDLFIVASYGKILPDELLNIPKRKTINVHPSLLPRWRGPSPVQYAILHGDTKTGTTIMLVTEKVDSGPILAQKETEIKKDDTYETLSNRLAKESADLLMDTIWPRMQEEIKPKEQDDSHATYTKIINKEDGHINWNTSYEYIKRQLRAFTPWPGIYTIWDEKRLKILELEGEQEYVSSVPGEVSSHSKGFAVQAQNGIIIPKQVQLEGKKQQTASEFLRGYPNIVGSHLL